MPYNILAEIEQSHLGHGPAANHRKQRAIRNDNLFLRASTQYGRTDFGQERGKGAQFYVLRLGTTALIAEFISATQLH